MTRHRKNSSASWMYASSTATSAFTTPASSRYPSRAPSRAASRASSPAPAERFRFFDLPAELRNRIYEFILFCPKAIDLGKTAASQSLYALLIYCRPAQLPPAVPTLSYLPRQQAHARRSLPNLLLASHPPLPQPRPLLSHQAAATCAPALPLPRSHHHPRTPPRPRLEQPASWPERRPQTRPGRLHEPAHAKDLRRNGPQ